MKLYNMMYDITLVHKYVVKNSIDNLSFNIGKFRLNINDNRIEFFEENDDDTAPFALLLLNVENGRLTHPNNIIPKDDGCSSFFRMSSDNIITIYTGNMDEIDTIDIPCYNDNEEELQFLMSLLTEGHTPVTLISILLTLDTNLCTFYTHRFTDNHIDIVIELLQEAKEWITQNTVRI